MRVEAIMLADEAAVRGGLLTIQGGGWETVETDVFPVNVAGFVTGVLTAEAFDPRFLIILEVGDEAGQVEGSRQSVVFSDDRTAPVAGVPVRLPFAINFTTAVYRPTVVTVRLADPDRELAMLTFAVRSTIPDGPSAP